METNSKPIYGFVQYPHSDFCAGQNPSMDIKAIVHRNFRRWKAEHPELGTLKQIAIRAGVGFGTVQRLHAGEENLSIETIEAIARVFHRKAAELLIDTESNYRAPTQPTVWQVQESNPDERLLLYGYRAASADVRELLLEAAKRALSKQEPHGRSDHQ